MKEPFLPFSRPTIGAREIADVVGTLRSGWLASGPRVAAFEAAFRERIGARYALAVTSATAALHLAYLATGIGPGDEVITTPLTFAATANMIAAVGARPVFADVDPITLNLDPREVECRITARTKAVVPVHFAGLPCAPDAFRSLCGRRNLRLIEDAAHAVGATFRGRPVGADSDIACFSFHPNKNITSGEGGMLVTSSQRVLASAALGRFHGIDKEAWRRMGPSSSPHFVQRALGFKYNLSDLQAAIGCRQLERLDEFNRRRRALAEEYRQRLSDVEEVELPSFGGEEDGHCWHLFVVRFRHRRGSPSRDLVLERLRKRGIGTGLHYPVLHLQPYYRRAFGYRPGQFPIAEDAARRLTSLPLFPAMRVADVRRVERAVREVVRGRR